MSSKAKTFHRCLWSPQNVCKVKVLYFWDCDALLCENIGCKCWQSSIQSHNCGYKALTTSADLVRTESRSVIRFSPAWNCAVLKFSSWCFSVQLLRTSWMWIHPELHPVSAQKPAAFDPQVRFIWPYLNTSITLGCGSKEAGWDLPERASGSQLASPP